MQQYVVNLARVLRGKRRAISSTAAHLRCPAMRARRVAQHRQCERLCRLALGLLVQEQRHRIEPCPMHRTDLRHRRAQLFGKLQRVNVPAARLHQVAHVQQHQRRQAYCQHRCSEHQLSRQVLRIQHQQYSIRLGSARHLAAQYVNRNTRILRIGIKRIDTRQIDQGQIIPAHTGHQSQPLFHGYAGKVGDLLPQSRQSIEECGFAGVRRPDQHNRPQFALRRRNSRGNERRWSAAGTAHRAASSSSGASFASTLSTSSATGGFTRIASAVSCRRAISIPSTP